MLKKTIARFLFIIFITALLVQPSFSDTIDLNCNDLNQTLESALQTAMPGDTLRIVGPCPNTAAMITQNNLTIEGVQNAVLDGGGSGSPVLTIVGVQNITIRNVTLRNGSIGLNLSNDAAAILENVTAELNTFGVRVQNNSSVQAANCLAQDNSGTGFFILGSSTLVVRNGNLESNRNFRGIELQSESQMTAIDATVSILDNMEYGIIMFASSLFAFDTAIKSSGNTAGGLAVYSNAQVSTRAINGSSSIELKNNEIGLDVRLGGRVTSYPSSSVLHPEAMIQGNGFGLIVDDASISLNDATINNNERDLFLAFGARVTIEAGLVNNVECDNSVLIRGIVSCTALRANAAKTSSAILLPVVPDATRP